MPDAPPTPEPEVAASAPAAPTPAPPPGGRVAWPPWMSVLGFVTGMAGTVVLGMLVFVVAAVAGVSNDAAGINIGLTVAQNIAFVGAALFFASISGGRLVAADFGLRRPPFWISVGLLVAVWIGFLILSAIWAAALDLDQHQDLPEELGADGPLPNVLAVVVLVTVFAPLAEELFFRGFFFGALRNWHGPWLAALLTGIVFGAVHIGTAPVGYLVPLAILGAGLCLLYAWTGSLYPSIALHALNNSIALGANLEWDWQIPAMMVGSTATALLCAWLLARALGDRRGPPATPAPAPGSA